MQTTSKKNKNKNKKNKENKRRIRRERNLRLSSSAWLEKVLKFGHLKLRIKSFETIKIYKNLLFTSLP